METIKLEAGIGDEIIVGCLEITVSDNNRCKECGGDGMVMARYKEKGYRIPCPECGGSGTETVGSDYDILFSTAIVDGISMDASQVIQYDIGGEESTVMNRIYDHDYIYSFAATNRRDAIKLMKECLVIANEKMGENSDKEKFHVTKEFDKQIKRG